MPPITVYSKPNCQPCKFTKKKFDDAQIGYTEIDISQDKEAHDYVLSLGAQAAPVVVIGDRWWAGMKPDLIKEVIDQHRALLADAVA